MEYQLTLNWPDFLERHWQKRPVVLKRGFNNFIDPISPDELAGLAMESEVDSRLVSHQDGKWPYQPDEIYDALKQGDVLVRLGGLRVLRIGDDVYANGEKIDSPHRPALDALASNIALTAENFGDALEDPSFLAMLAALVNSGYWFFEG